LIAPAESAVREQLERILISPDFAAAEVARKLLRFLVEESLAGRSSSIKEYTIAVEVLGRDSSFDPKVSPAVRVEASRLRRRLEHYYLTLGRSDPVLIEVPRGTYVPAFLPHADVLHLREDLTQARVERGAGAADERLTVPLPGGPVIVVVPFENLGDEADTVFGDGITVEIVTALCRFRAFNVLGRETVFRRRGEQDAVRLHQELGAGYVLTGSVQRAAGRLRIHAQLLSGANGKVLWAERYDRDLEVDKIFEVEDEIASHVVSTVAQPYGVIGRPEAAIARRKPPESLDAYDCLLLFYDYGANRSPEGHRKIRAALEAAVQKEPEVAILWAALAMVHNDTWRFGFNTEATTREEARDLALREARKAARLDPLASLGYHALFLAQFARGDFDAFREAGNRALELNPNQTDTLADYGVHLALCDDWTLGRLYLKSALALNPEPPDWYWFVFFIWHYEHGEFDAALDMALRSQNDAFFWTHGMHAMAYGALGMRKEAATAVERLLEVYPEFPDRARDELSLWVSPERTERLLEGLRNAGVPIRVNA
jgi:adenylate cyclase